MALGLALVWVVVVATLGANSPLGGPIRAEASQPQHAQPPYPAQPGQRSNQLAQAWQRTQQAAMVAQQAPPNLSRVPPNSSISATQVSAAQATEGLGVEAPPGLSASANDQSLAEAQLANPNINNAGAEITNILKKFFLHGYDKRVRPNYSGPPALVNVSFHIIGISSVSEVQMDFTTDFYFRQKWFDPRLQFKPVGQIDELCVGAEFAERIWLPDTFFANEKTANFHKATTENTFIRVKHNGRVYRSIRLTVTCSCPMDLQYFPMDRQRCKIEIESYGYNTRDIDYRWEKGNESVSLDGKIELPQFKVLGFKMGQELQSLSSGDYIRLYCEIHFVRSMGYYLIQIYIPASLIVNISWVSFWLHRNATPARVALGVTTVLTMTTLMSSTNAALPKISYIKSIDVFLGTCFVMVFAALLEYASVGYIGKRIAMKRKRKQDLKQLQQHHQKVCVAAAAASAASATSASSGGRDKSPAGPRPLGSPPPEDLLVVAGKHSSKFAEHLASAWHGATARSQPSAASVHHLTTTKSSKPPPMATPAASGGAPPDPAAGGADPNSGGQKAPEEVIKILGLTPSAIDKYSRVVFPICFVCFNLMYWIIYGHISQQIDDNGPPLIPFVRT